MTIELSAKYYDGATSRANDVRLRLDELGVLHVLGLPVAVSHPLSAVRIAPRLGSTLRSVALPGGAKCESDDHAALDELMRRAGTGRAASLIHAIESRWSAALLSALALVLCLVVGTKWGIPLLARRVADSVPRELAYDLGKGTLAVLDGTLLQASTLPAERRNELEASFAAMAAQYPELPMRLLFRRGVGPNALALPDGTVIVLDELVDLAQNDQEILAVVAHEIGHVHHRHGLRMALESSAVVLLVSTYFGDITEITTLSASLPGIYAKAQYSQDQEREADGFALDHLKRAGISPKHFASILSRLEAALGSNSDGALRYLASHPPTTERIQRFERD